MFSRVATLLLSCVAIACEPELVVGTLTCTARSETVAGEGGAAGGTSDAGEAPVFLGAVAMPWSTSFEEGFCDYRWAGGFCYSKQDAGYELVTEPVRSGRYAAAFTVTADAMLESVGQARCVRQGAFPREGYYGAWYYVPSLVTNAGNWNLFHFQGGTPQAQHGLWDVSLRNDSEGALGLYVFDFLGSQAIAVEPAPPIPIGVWFHVEFRWKRAADETGEASLHQDGRLVARASERVTDDTDWGQWYVGNLADALVPAGSTIYVDDVTIRSTP